MERLLALSLNGTPIQTPGGIGSVTPGKVGPYGQNIFQLGIQILLAAAIILSLFYLIWGGIGWIMSGGDKAGVEAARNKIIYALVGLVLTLLSFFIISVIGKAFGITLVGI